MGSVAGVAPVVILLLAAARIALAGSAGELEARALAARPDPRHGQILYFKHCPACHGQHAWGDGPREIPALAGQRPSYLLEQLARFATGERAGSTMHGPAMHDTLQPPDINRPQALTDLAAFLAAAARNPHPERVATTVAGATLYARACSQCHGSEGAGSDREAVPAIGGQQQGYLRGQLTEISAGHRAHPPFAEGAVALTAAELRACADYAAGLSFLTAAAGGP